MLLRWQCKGRCCLKFGLSAWAGAGKWCGDQAHANAICLQDTSCMRHAGGMKLTYKCSNAVLVSGYAVL
jgi:hypothetical protein